MRRRLVAEWGAALFIAAFPALLGSHPLPGGAWAGGLGLPGFSERPDVDGDGVTWPADCNDRDPRVFPGAPDRPGDGIDSDCDGLERCWRDSDGDGEGDPMPLARLTVANDADCDDPGESTNTSDACPYDVPPDDDDGDGVCDTDDRCWGYDDRLDADQDGRPDDCDLVSNDPTNPRVRDHARAVASLQPGPDGRLVPFDATTDLTVRTGFPCYGEQLRVCVDSNTGRSVAFALYHPGPSPIIPTAQGYRAYWFEYWQRSQRSVSLRIYECARCAERDSQWSMTTTIVLLPRYGLPTVQRVGDIVEVRLPTAEPVCFDATSGEIVGGVLVEGRPMDVDANPARRRFADVRYRGSGVMVRADQLAETPKQGGAQAVISWEGRTCRVRRSSLWEQHSGWYDLRFDSDEAFFDFVEATCGWTLPDYPAQSPWPPSCLP